jgi:tetratricopeptide (TPR) repeat protein
MGRSTGKRLKRQKKARRSGQPQGGSSYSPLGWIVLLVPLFIILFVLLFGKRLPFLIEAAREGAESEALTHAVAGKAAMDAGRNREARAHFLRALEYGHECIQAHVNLAKVLHLVGETDAAIRRLEKAAALNPPQIGLIYNNLGAFHGKKGDLETASRCFRLALEAGMTAAYVYRNLGEASALLQRWPEAAEAYRKAIEYRTTVKTLYMQKLRETIAESYQDPDRRELHEKAVAHYRSNLPDAHFLRYDNGIVENLLVDWNVVAADHEYLAEALAELGRHKEAARMRQRAAQIRARHCSASR